jgi:hypothetical protein
MNVKLIAEKMKDIFTLKLVPLEGETPLDVAAAEIERYVQARLASARR